MSKVELTEKLTWELLDDQLSAAGLNDLETLMREDPECLKCYLTCVQLEQDLKQLFRVDGMEAEASPKLQLPGFPQINLAGDGPSTVSS